MKFHHRRFVHLAGVAAAIAVLSVTVTGHGAWSQTARTIKVVVSVQPGGGTDFLARVLAEQIARAQGPTMVIENRPGAGSIIGTEAVSHAAPDGNTNQYANFCYQSASAKGELRSGDQLRADLLPGGFADGHRRQQRITLSDSRRSA